MSSERSIGPRLAGAVIAATLFVVGPALPAFAAAPTISSFTPTGGPVGCQVTITGTNFTSPAVNTVTFGADTGTPVDQTTVIVDSSTQVRAGVPTGALTGKLTVTSNVTSAQSSGTFTVGGSCVSPTITSFSPTSGPVGTSVTITGTNFTGATAVKFSNNKSATFTVDSGTQITATVPNGATTGTISVATSSGTATSADPFTIKHLRSISLTLGGKLTATGAVTLSDGTSVCASGVPVKIEHRVNGRWRRVGTGTTTSTGSYSIRVNNGLGKVPGRAIRTTLADADVCARASSAVVFH
jgi:hypothetical protein